MPALVVGGVTVSVAVDGAERLAPEPIGGAPRRMFDGSLRWNHRGFKQGWNITTTPLTSADRTTLEAQLTSTSLPVSCSGDILGGAVSCIPEPGSVTPIAVAGGGIRFVVKFTLREA